MLHCLDLDHQAVDVPVQVDPRFTEDEMLDMAHLPIQKSHILANTIFIESVITLVLP